MDIKAVGKLISELAEGVLIVGGNEKILWVNEYIEKKFGTKNLIKEKFEDVFGFGIISEATASDKVFEDDSNKSYGIKARQLTDQGEKYTIVLFESRQDYSNKDVKVYCLENILETIDDGIIISDCDGKVVLYNKAQEILEDIDASDIVGKYLWEGYKYDLMEKSEHREVFKTGIPKINFYKAHSYHEGIPKYVSYSTYPLVKNGEKLGVYSISKNEIRLQSLLAETIELRRRFAQSGEDMSQTPENPNGTRFLFSDIVGSSEKTLNTIREAETMSMLDNNILIIGDTGTGKEVYAQSIHNFSKRRTEPFIAINCAAIPETLLESILFGAAKGAYTGAVGHTGLFEEAGDGTLFLDELNSMPVSMQTKLLRVLQEKKVRRVGDVNTVPVKCRVMCAMNEEPYKLIQSGRLRQDLFYRISSLCLYIVPLRERKEDILDFTFFFINKFNKLLSKNIKSLSPQLQKIMLEYKWPGNVRELEHMVENLMIRASENQKALEISNMPLYIQEMVMNPDNLKASSMRTESLPDTLRSIEEKIIFEGLNKNNWNISATSKELGVIRQSLLYRMKKLGIIKEKNV
ncbi:MAG: sigma-54 interaction domain-containing protein [Clostridiaceae bacterium]